MTKDRIRSLLPELIYGANDGIVTTLAIVSGVVGAQLSTTVILILGFANLLADGVSMGASNVLSQRSNPDTIPTYSETLPGGLATFGGFLAAGLVPLVAYLLPDVGVDRFYLCISLAAVALFAVGASRALLTEQNWVPAGMEMLVIGLAAAAIAFAVGKAGAAIAGL